MNMNKTACKIGMILGIVIIIAGFITMFTNVDIFSGETAGSRYDSGYTAFGADFYTYVNNNAAEAAKNVRAVGNSMEKAANIFTNTMGWALVLFGAFDVCLFWAFLGNDEKPFDYDALIAALQKTPAAQPAAPAEPEAPEAPADSEAPETPAEPEAPEAPAEPEAPAAE